MAITLLSEGIWEGVKRARGGVASPLCDTPTRRSDEGGRASCRMLCMYTTVWGVECEVT